MRKYLLLISILAIAFLSITYNAYSATIQTVTENDSIDTWYQNYNTSITNLNNDKFDKVTETLDDIPNGTTYKLLTATKDGYINQDVTNGSSPSFLGLTLNSVGYSFPASDGTNGYVLTTNGAGTLSWGAGGAGSQTPWTSNIDGAGYNLSNVGILTVANIISTSTSADNYFLGKVGIGTTTPAYDLDVYGNIRADGDVRTTGTFYGDTWSSATNNSMAIQPSGDVDDFFSFKTPAHRPTIKREGGKFIYLESSNVYDVGISARADDTYSGTLNYEKDNHMLTMLGKNSPLGFKANSDYDDYIKIQTSSNIPEITVASSSALKINAGGTNSLLLNHSGGNVGIGTTSPLSTFSMNSGANGFRIDSSGIVQQGTWNGTALTDAYVSNTLTVDGYMQDTDIDTFAELQSWAVGYTDNNTTYTGGTGITLTGTVFSTTDSEIVHDNLSGFVANEHLDWTADLGAVNIHAGNYTDTNTTYLGGTGLTLTDTTFSVDTSQNISTLSNLTTNGFVITSGGTGALSIDTNTYLTGNQSITLSGDITGSGATAITTTIGANKILESMLKSVNAPTDEYVLTYESTTGDFEWQASAGGGDVSKVGTPVDNQVGVWTGDGTIEGTAGLTYDGSNLLFTGDIGSTGAYITKAWLTDLIVTNAIAGSITGNADTCTTASAGDAAVDFFGAGVDAVTDATTCTNIEGTNLSITAGVLNAVDTNTNANTVCAGGTTYMDGEGNCDDISSVYEGTLTNSAGLLAALSDETGTGVAVFGTSPTITTSIDLPAGAINTATEIAADIITHTQILDADQADTKCIWFEDPTATDDFKSIWSNKTANNFLFTEIWGESDQTVSFDLQIDDGTPADVSGTDIAPAAGEAEDTTLAGDTTLAAGEELDLIITSVTNTPTWVSICWTGNWVD